MKTTKNKSDKEADSPAKKAPANDPSQLDQLDVQRGQNGEKGNTLHPETIRKEKEVSH